MFGVNQRFGKHCSCHFEGRYENATLKMATAVFAETLVNIG
jgi:hypothetical protein